VKFIVDAQLPPALARFIRSTGYECEHVADVGLRDADDSPIWRHADANGRVIIAKDEDFAVRKMLQPSGPAVVWLRVGNCSNRALLAWFQPLFDDIVDRLQKGEGLIEVV